MNAQRFKDIGIGILFVLAQLLMFRHLKFYHTGADLVLVYIIWYMLHRTRTGSIFMAAGLGLLYDMLLDTWGVHMFSKTLIAFSLYNFMPRLTEFRLSVGQIFLLVLGVALFHNIVFLGITSFLDAFAEDLFFWRHWLGNSLYTALVGSFLYLFFND